AWERHSVSFTKRHPASCSPISLVSPAMQLWPRNLVQESYSRFLRADLKSGDEGYQNNYLFRIATNLAHDRWWRMLRTEKLEHETREKSRVDERTAERVQQSSDLARALRQLKPREREILWLAYVEGCSHNEIAEVVGLRTGSIRLLLFRARR